MDASLSSDRSVRTIRLDDDRIAKILDTMDAATPKSGSGRKDQRYTYRMKSVVLHMQQPGSTITVPYLVPTRNISECGLSVLHGGFVHNATRCVVQLITTYGTWDDVPGSVLSCRYIEANIHEVSLQFDRRIDPSIYCTAAVHSRVLLVEDDPAVARLVTFYLKQMNAGVELAENGRIAVEKAMRSAFDLILMDMEMPVMDGFAAVRQLRAKGYTGTIIAATALTQSGDTQRCLDAGCDRYIAKPHKPEVLAGILQSLRDEPLISTLYNDSSMTEMIDTYVRELPLKVRAIEETMVENDAKRLETVIRSLKAEGASYGFSVITEAAEEIETALINGVEIKTIKKETTALLKLCLQARSAGKPSE